MASPFELSILFGLLASLSWGLGDFSGGVASRRARALLVSLYSNGFGAALLLLVSLVLGETFPSLGIALLGFVAGSVGSLGLLALYRAMAIGEMGIASPASAVLTAGLPVLFTALTQSLPSALQLLGFALALAGVWLVSRPDGSHTSSQTLWWALLSSLGFAGFKILMSLVPDGAVWWPLMLARTGGFVCMIAMVLASRTPVHIAKSIWPLALLSGSLDTLGNAGFLLSAQFGRLDTASVLSALYPAVTAAMAFLVLRERLKPLQLGGVILMLAAILLISAG
jgi:drug/metabolite transporter (DMT)-like permease